ncbi:MAG: hypothetical protein KJZ80_09375 [Hyphomicrobiaceae bacterium]|nr:hypothetical protein [Hyphomicrobiaceae bacterium]
MITSIVLSAALAFVTVARAEDRRCFASWSEAAELVKQEQLVAVEQLSRQAQARLGGSIVKTTLCAIGQRYVYRLVVRLPDGLMRFFSLDARKPFDR